MKLRNILFSSFLLASVLCSCADEEYVENSGNSENSVVKFSSTIAAEKTKAANMAWNENDAIGVFMKTGAGLSSIVEDAENKQYSTSGDGIFTPVTDADAIYFPSTGTVDFVAYYPYIASLTDNIYPVDVADQSSQEAIDLLYSDNATGKQSGDAVLLNFQHQLSKVIFNIQAGEGVSSLGDLSVKISGLKVKGGFDLSDKSLVEEVVVSDVEMKTTSNGLTALAEGIILPTLPAERKFIFTLTIDGEVKTFDWDASAQSFEKGKKNIYTVTLNAEKAVSVNPDAMIEDWGAGSSEEVVINPGEEVVTEEFFSETFGQPIDPENPNVNVDDFDGFDMPYPVTYSSGGIILPLQTLESRFPDNGYFITMLQHNGDPLQDKSLIIDGIQGVGYFDMELTYDYAAGAEGMNLNDMVLRCDGVEVELPEQVIKNRDRFEPVTVAIPDGTTKIEFIQNKQTAGFMRIDNVKITGSRIVAE